MVSFICNACGNTVRKNQVEKHYATQCRNCTILSCIDCGVDFPGDSYAAHTSCITEAEKYQGHLYQAKDKENKGEVKQKEWLKQVHSASGNIQDPKLKTLLKKLSAYSNIPRKRKKFENFCKNSVNVYDAKTLDQLWDAFNASNQKQDSDVAVGIDVKVNKEMNGNVVNEEEDENSIKEISSKSLNSNISEETEEVKEGTDEEAYTLVTKKKKKSKKRLPEIAQNADDNSTNNIDSLNNGYNGKGSGESEITTNNDNGVSEFEVKCLHESKKRKKKKIILNGDDSSGCESENIGKRSKLKNGSNNTEMMSNRNCGDKDGREDKETNGGELSKNKSGKRKSKKHKLVDEIKVEEGNGPEKKKKRKKGQQEKENEVVEDNCEEIKEHVKEGKFNWHKAIKTFLKQSDDRQLSMKKLRKKVLLAYEEHGIDHRAATLNDSRSLFDKKLKSYPKVKILKDVVMLIK